MTSGNPHDERREGGPRYLRRLDVSFGEAVPPEQGIIHNLSRTGFGFYTRVVLLPGRQVDAWISTADGEAIPVSVEVRWSRALPTDQESGFKFEMGVYLAKAPAEYLALFERIRGQVQTAKAATQTTERLPVRFTEPSDVAPLVSSWQAATSLYCERSDQPQVGMLAVVPVQLPSLADVVCAVGRVSRLSEEGDLVELRYLRMVVGDVVLWSQRLRGGQAELGLGLLPVFEQPSATS